MRQGLTKLALYGLGNMRDERLGRLFQTPGAVSWCAGTVLNPRKSTAYACRFSNSCENAAC